MNGQNAHFGIAGQRRRAGSHQRRLVVGLGGGGVDRLCDFALGSDTGGSVRAPANHCGAGRPAADARPRRPAGRARPGAELRHLRLVHARRADLRARRRRAARRRPGAAAARPRAPARADRRLGAARARGARGAARAARARRGRARPAAPVEVVLDGFDAMYWSFRYLQGREAWRTDGALIERFAPPLGPGVAERFAWARDGHRCAGRRGERVPHALSRPPGRLLGGDGVLLMPTMPDVAPLVSADEAGLEDYRNRATRMLCIAGLAGFPQLSLPLGSAPRRAARPLAARAGGQRPQPGAAGRTDRPLTLASTLGRGRAHRGVVLTRSGSLSELKKRAQDAGGVADHGAERRGQRTGLCTVARRNRRRHHEGKNVRPRGAPVVAAASLGLAVNGTKGRRVERSSSSPYDIDGSRQQMLLPKRGNREHTAGASAPSTASRSWSTGEVAGTCTDSRDHIFIVTRGNLIISPEDARSAFPPRRSSSSNTKARSCCLGRPERAAERHPRLLRRLPGQYLDRRQRRRHRTEVHRTTAALLLQIGTRGVCDNPPANTWAIRAPTRLANQSKTLLNQPADMYVDPKPIR